jgi:serine protease Do
MMLYSKMRQQKLMSATLMLFTLSVGILIGTLINTKVHAAKDQNVAPDASPLSIPKASEIGNDFTALAKRLEPSVVNINVEMTAPAVQVQPRRGRGQGQVPPPTVVPPDSSDDPQVPDFFRRFFGQDGTGDDQVIPQGPQKREASGTGFIVDKNGYIITNNHVVENATKIRVKLHGDPNDYRGRVIGTDIETDLAVIKIDAYKPLQPVSIGNSDGIQVGDWAVAIGSPFGLEATVTAGIVSATGRDATQLPGAKQLQRFIQTDAAINPGNSGGPLLNIHGEVIGVNTMIATSGGGSQGVGFALPVNLIVRVYNDIIRTGRVTRGSIGVSLARPEKPEVTLRAFGLDHGVIVEKVTPGGPAQAAGIKDSDIILGINGQPVKDGDDLVARVSDLPVGSQASVNVDREGKKMDFKIAIKDRIEVHKDERDIVGEAPQESVSAKQETVTTVQFGFKPRALTEQERDQLEARRGVMVIEVTDDSFAQEVGIEEHDVIDSINRIPVNSFDDVVKIKDKLKPGDPVAFHVTRGIGVPTVATPRNTRNPGAVALRSQQIESRYLSGYLPH